MLRPLLAACLLLVVAGCVTPEQVFAPFQGPGASSSASESATMTGSAGGQGNSNAQDADAEPNGDSATSSNQRSSTGSSAASPTTPFRLDNATAGRIRVVFNSGSAFETRGSFASAEVLVNDVACAEVRSDIEDSSLAGDGSPHLEGGDSVWAPGEAVVLWFTTDKNYTCESGLDSGDTVHVVVKHNAQVMLDASAVIQ